MHKVVSYPLTKKNEGTNFVCAQTFANSQTFTNFHKLGTNLSLFYSQTNILAKKTTATAVFTIIHKILQEKYKVCSQDLA